jgi:hypothetical protein
MGIINFSLQAVENNDSCRPDGDENEGQQSEQEPDSLAAHLVAWLGDAEGSKEGGRKSLKESHALMVRGCIARRGYLEGYASIGDSGKESRAAEKHPMNHVAACRNRRSRLD